MLSYVFLCKTIDYNFNLSLKESDIALTKYPVKKSPYKCRFDFEIGYLVKSPCRECDRRKTYFPDCSENCMMLGKVQNVLSASVSCHKRA